LTVIDALTPTTLTPSGSGPRKILQHGIYNYRGRVSEA
jgi:hypothetical protein